MFEVEGRVRKRLTRTARRTLASLPACLALAGCYSFAPVDRAVLEPGMSVRITLEREEVLRQADARGDLDPVLRGTITDQTTEETLGLLYRPAGTSRFNRFLAVPWSGVRQVEAKAFSPARTVGLVAIGAAITVAVIAVTDQSGENTGEDPPGDNLVSIPLPWFRW